MNKTILVGLVQQSNEENIENNKLKLKRILSIVLNTAHDL